MAKQSASPKRRGDAKICGIDTSVNTRCNSSTTLNREFCKLNGANKCVFRTNPNDPKRASYTLRDIRRLAEDDGLRQKIAPTQAQLDAICEEQSRHDADSMQAAIFSNIAAVEHDELLRYADYTGSAICDDGTCALVDGLPNASRSTLLHLVQGSSGDLYRMLGITALPEEVFKLQLSEDTLMTNLRDLNKIPPQNRPIAVLHSYTQAFQCAHETSFRDDQHAMRFRCLNDGQFTNPAHPGPPDAERPYFCEAHARDTHTDLRIDRRHLAKVDVIHVYTPDLSCFSRSPDDGSMRLAISHLAAAYRQVFTIFTTTAARRLLLRPLSVYENRLGPFQGVAANLTSCAIRAALDAMSTDEIALKTLHAREIVLCVRGSSADERLAFKAAFPASARTERQREEHLTQRGLAARIAALLAERRATGRATQARDDEEADYPPLPVVDSTTVGGMAVSSSRINTRGTNCAGHGLSRSRR